MSKQEKEFRRIMHHVRGKKSSAWGTWCGRLYAEHPDTPAFIMSALTAALLELGEPPHPDFLTTDIAGSMEVRLRFDKRSRIQQQHILREQYRWNKRFNEWVIIHGLHFGNRSSGPAQFRKVFASWWQVEVLHACK